MCHQMFGDEWISLEYEGGKKQEEEQEETVTVSSLDKFYKQAHPVSVVNS